MHRGTPRVGERAEWAPLRAAELFSSTPRAEERFLTPLSQLPAPAWDLDEPPSPEPVAVAWEADDGDVALEVAPKDAEVEPIVRKPLRHLCGLDALDHMQSSILAQMSQHAMTSEDLDELYTLATTAGLESAKSEFSAAAAIPALQESVQLPEQERLTIIVTMQMSTAFGGLGGPEASSEQRLVPSLMSSRTTAEWGPSVLGRSAWRFLLTYDDVRTQRADGALSDASYP
ncbi:unnamed protein product [Malassezia sympodialis ATCC 42132]|uniref:uncharacterized protein n=1 Tax=Malassezia sympodialis (strain ATCC 42132) TaxID=1230383 RepID=UPI0002C24EDE|nr:uncharacterized protein MSY001_0661 [Malassezia sympodialis ATCC 42132]CCU97955.1 unnamed protein product [Malassezia sympodialis ATCC 42132]|eukprot:XP_018739279.1 uncharacterized protein MSY001_0661 [Malassezia sympodialis ATCC 42132]